MATLPTTAIGVRNAGLSDANTSLVGTEPVLQLIASANDANSVQMVNNQTITAVAAFELGNTPADFDTMNSLAVRLRYAWTTTPNGLLTWNSLTAQAVTSGGTALTNAVTIATNIGSATKVNSSVTTLTGLNTTANKATWDGAVILIRFQTTRSMGGDGTANPAVYAGELTGDYDVAAAAATGHARITWAQIEVPGVPIEGSLAETQADQTVAASGSVVVPTHVRVSQVYLEAPEGIAVTSGSLTETQADQTSTASGHLSYSGSLAETEDDDTLAASGTFFGSFTGTLAETQNNQTAAASGAFSAAAFSGSVAEAQDDQTGDGAGHLAYTGAAAETQASDTLSASGAFSAAEFSGAVAATQDDQTVAAAGAFEVENVTGSLGAAAVFQPTVFQPTVFQVGDAYVQDDQTVSATGVSSSAEFSGSLTETQADQTAAASGHLEYTATLDVTQAAETVTASGTYTSADFVGAVAATQDSDTAAGTGHLSYTGSIGITHHGDTADAVGWVEIVGDVDITQDGQTAAAAAVFFGIVDLTDQALWTETATPNRWTDSTRPDRFAGDTATPDRFAGTARLSPFAGDTETPDRFTGTPRQSPFVGDTATPDRFVGTIRVSPFAGETANPDRWSGTVRPDRFAGDTATPVRFTDTARPDRFAGGTATPNPFAGTAVRPDRWSGTIRPDRFYITTFHREGDTVALTFVEIGPYTENEVPEALMVRWLRTHADGTTSGLPLHAQTPAWTVDVHIEKPSGSVVTRAAEILDPDTLTTEFPDAGDQGADGVTDGDDGWVRVAFQAGDLDESSAATDYGIQLVADNGTLLLKTGDVWVPKVNTGPAEAAVLT